MLEAILLLLQGQEQQLQLSLAQSLQLAQSLLGFGATSLGGSGIGY